MHADRLVYSLQLVQFILFSSPFRNSDDVFLIVYDAISARFRRTVSADCSVKGAAMAALLLLADSSNDD